MSLHIHTRGVDFRDSVFNSLKPEVLQIMKSAGGLDNSDLHTPRWPL